MYIPIITFSQSVARSVLKSFARDIIASHEKPHSIRTKIEYIDWYCELLSSLIEEERLNAIAGELSIILDTTDNKHLRKALKDSVKYNAAARKALYKKQCALKRNWGNEERKDNGRRRIENSY